MNGTSQRYRARGLDQLLKREGRKQRWLANEVGISEALLSYIVSGERTASEKVAEAIAEALGKSLFLIFESTSVDQFDLERDEIPA
jgi:transcriptional regulator with XRE-family HTH domain